MGWFENLISKRIAKAIEKYETMKDEFTSMKVNFENLENVIEKFIDRTEDKIEFVKKENEDIRRRLTESEALINATIKSSMEGAVKNAVYEYLKEGKDLRNLTEEEVRKLLNGEEKK